MPSLSQPESKQPDQRPTWAEIDLDALGSNFQVIKGQVGREIKVMAVVKADAYGHGAVACARRLEQEGADWFAVALPEEGIELRAAGIAPPVLCLGGFWAGQEQACIRHRLATVVYRLDTIAALDRAAQDAGTVADVHVKIDTGMSRLGVRPNRIREFCAALSQFRHINVEGMMTHFASADEPSLDEFTIKQVRLFDESAEVFRAAGFNIRHYHLANSAGVFGHEATHWTMVRPGGALYGLRDTLPAGVDVSALRPVMSLHSRIALLKWVEKGEPVGYGCTFVAPRRTLVGTVPIGYEDGYRRALSNRGRVIVRGAYAPVIGRVSMDLTLIDVTDVPGVAIDDQVTLLGKNADLAISAEDMARVLDTISYEVTCGISSRVPRLYV